MITIYLYNARIRHQGSTIDKQVYGPDVTRNSLAGHEPAAAKDMLWGL